MTRMRIFRRHSFTRWWTKPVQEQIQQPPYWGVLSFGALRIVWDRFTRADSSSSLGSTETGQPWVANSGTWGITSNQANLVSSTTNATAVVETNKSDCTVEVTLVVGGDAGLCWRSTDDSNNYIWFTVSGGGIDKRVAGSYTRVFDNAALVATDGDILKVVLSGDTHSIYKNGGFIGSFTDSFNQGATKHGLRSNWTTVMFDEFAVY